MFVASGVAKQPNAEQRAIVLLAANAKFTSLKGKKPGTGSVGLKSNCHGHLHVVFSTVPLPWPSSARLVTYGQDDL